MQRICDKCSKQYDDFNCYTLCPHDRLIIARTAARLLIGEGTDPNTGRPIVYDGSRVYRAIKPPSTVMLDKSLSTTMRDPMDASIRQPPLVKPRTLEQTVADHQEARDLPEKW